MEYYTVIEKNEVLIHGTAWMNLKNTLLSEKVVHTLYDLHLYKMSRIGTLYRKKVD